LPLLGRLENFGIDLRPPRELYREKAHACAKKYFKTTGRVQFFEASRPNSVAMDGRYQMKLDQHNVLIFDAFVGFPEDRATTLQPPSRA
jgi:hypothetical protein